MKRFGLVLLLGVALGAEYYGTLPLRFDGNSRLICPGPRFANKATSLKFFGITEKTRYPDTRTNGDFCRNYYECPNIFSHINTTGTRYSCDKPKVFDPTKESCVRFDFWYHQPLSSEYSKGRYMTSVANCLSYLHYMDGALQKFLGSGRNKREAGSDEVADKSAAEDQTVVKMVDEEGLEQTVVEETTSLTKEAELEDKYMTLDKPEPVEEDDNKKETTSEATTHAWPTWYDLWDLNYGPL